MKTNQIHSAGYKTLFSLLFALCLCFVLQYCNKKPQDPAPEQLDKTTFQISTSEVAQLEGVLLTFRKKPDLEPKTARLGSVALSITAIDDTLYTFVVPADLTPGPYNFSINGYAGNLPVKVKPLAQVSNPDRYLQDFTSELLSARERLLMSHHRLIELKLMTGKESYEILSELDFKLTDVINRLALMNLQQKASMAATLSANRTTLDSMLTGFEEARIDGSGNARVLPNCPQKPFDQYAKCTARQLITIGLFLTSSFKILFAIPDPTFKALAGITLFLSVRELEALLKHNLSTPGIYLEDSEPELSNLRTANAPFQNGIGRRVVFSIPVRNFQESLDENSKNEDFRNLAAVLKSLRNWSTILNSFFKFIIPAVPLSKGISYPDDQDKLKVEVVGNNEVSGVAKISENNSIELTFKTSEKGVQNFDYKISYEYDGKTVQRTVLAAQLVSDYKEFKITGVTDSPIRSGGISYTEYQFQVTSEEWVLKPTTKFIWDFGDNGGKINVTGNSMASYYYKKDGNFDISVTIEEDGRVIGVGSAKASIYTHRGQVPVTMYFTANGKDYASDKNSLFQGVSGKIDEWLIGGWTNKHNYGEVCTITFYFGKEGCKGAGTYDLGKDVYADLSVYKKGTEGYPDYCYGNYSTKRSTDATAGGTLTVISYEAGIIVATFELTAGVVYNPGNETTLPIRVTKGRIMGSVYYNR